MARVGSADGYHDAQVGGIAGKAWGSGSAFVSVDYAKNSALLNSDREFITNDRRRFGGADARSTTCSPGTISYGGATYPLGAGNGRGVLLSSLSSGPANRCDLSQYNSLIPETEHGSVYGYAEQKLSDSIKVFAQGFFYSRTGESARQSYTLTNYRVPTTNVFYPADVASSGTPVLINYSFNNVLGPDYADVSSKVSQVLAGIDGDIGDYHYKLTASTGRGEDEENNAHALSNYAVAQAIASSDPATAFNVFGGPGANSAALIQQLATGQSIIRGTTHLKTLVAGVDGPLFSLPAGAVRTAVGVEARRESSDAYAFNTANSRTSTVPVITGSSVSRTIKAVYGELLVPLFGAKNRLPLLNQLDISLAGRWEKYSDFGTTNNPKVGVNWKPVNDIVLHASYGTSFRAPSLSESNPRSSGAGIYTGQTIVPGRGLVSTVTLAGGNADLEPEKARTKSFGIDLAPASMPGFKAGLTYFDIVYDNQVVEGFGLQGNYLLDPVTYAKYVAYPGAANYESLKNLIETSGFTSPGTINYTSVAVIDARKTNTAAVKVDGLDLQLSNVWRLENGSTFTVRGNVTHYLKYDEAPNGKSYIDRNNVIAYPARNSGRISGTWRLGGWSAQMSANYTNGYINNLSTLMPAIASYTTVDTDLAYTFESDGLMDGMRLSLNVRNLFDKAPPVADFGTGYDPSKASALGRVVAVTVNKSW
jgi:iron complex outermembrane receptor protein